MKKSDNIATDKLLYILNNTSSVIVTTLFVLAFMVYLVSDHAAQAKLMMWLGYMVCYMTLSLLYSFKVKKDIVNDKLDIKWSFNSYYILNILYGVGWASFSILFFMSDHLVEQVIVASILIFVASSSISVISSALPVYAIYLSLTLGPIIYEFFMQGDEYYKTFALVVFTFGLFLLRSARHFEKALTDSFSLRYDNEKLLKDMQEAQDETISINKKLAIQIQEKKRTEQELIKQKNKAEDVVRMKGEFLATMSHEIRTPMNGILGMADLLLGTELGGKQKHFAKTIKSSGESLLTIINDILDFSKIESGKFDINCEAFELRYMLEECVSLFAEPAIRNKVDIHCDYAPKMHSIFIGDKIRVKQIVNNLLSNAIKFTKNGEVSIVVSFKEEDEQQAQVLIKIKDTGIGIPKEVREKIFDSFTQADGSTTRKYGGTGLGLAICKKLVNLMDGDIGVDSKPNQGSCFWIELPLKKATESDIDQDDYTDLSSLKDKKVLIADDNEASQEILMHQLKTWGMQCYAAKTGKEALHLLMLAKEQNQEFDLAIVDRKQSGINGMLLAEKIINNPSIKNTKIIILTTVGHLEETGTWMKYGISAYLQKPIRQTDLLEALNKSIVEDQSTKSTEATAAPEKTEDLSEMQLKGHILVAEDNIVNIELITLVLDNFGLRYQVAENGKQAVDAITENDIDRIRDPYNLILMDCQMPFMDGFAATKYIRNWEQENDYERMPIVALTANAMQGDKKRCIDAGMDDYLSKPFTQYELGLMLKQWLPVVKKQTLSEISEKDHLVEVKKNQTHQSATTKLDKSALNRIRSLQRENQPDVLLKVIDLYLENTPGLIEKIRNAVNIGDAQTICQTAHSLKSSSASLGATSLADICRDMEQMGKNNSLQNIFEKMDIMDFEYDAVCEALQIEADKQKHQQAA